MWRIVDIGGEGYFLHVDRDNFIATKNNHELMRIHFSDIFSIICHSYGSHYSDKFFKKCLEYKIPFIICDQYHVPQGMVLPFMQHTDSSIRLQTQIKATDPQKKKAWKFVITEKLLNQARLLQYIEHDYYAKKIFYLSKHVLSGDQGNRESQGAKIYFPALFGKEFLRTQQPSHQVNILLNYGYTILRSCVARSVIGAGLHPSFGIFHSARQNPYCLIDDLIEPFRPLVDFLVVDILKKYEDITLLPFLKKKFISLSKCIVLYQNQSLELTTALQYFVQDFYKYLDREVDTLSFPKFEYGFSI